MQYDDDDNDDYSCNSVSFHAMSYRFCMEVDLDNDDDDNDDYSCTSVNFQAGSSRFCMEEDLNNYYYYYYCLFSCTKYRHRYE